MNGRPPWAPRGRLTMDHARIAARYGAALNPPLHRRAAGWAIAAFLFGLAAWGFAALGVDGQRFIRGFATLGHFLVHMIPPDTGSWAKFLVYAQALAETVAIAFLGTLIASVLALPAGLLAARNVMGQRVLHFLSRRFLDTIRGVDELIWALIWVNVVGLGPFAGILAIASANFGAFGKLYSEAIEAADHQPVDGVLSTGSSKALAVRFALLPQVLPVMISQVLYYFESNTRSATIIGIVGAGGIGLHLAEQIRSLEYQHVSALILMILLAVATIDQVSTRLRGALIGQVAQRA